MQTLKRNAFVLAWCLVTAALFAAVALPTHHFAATLREPTLVSGYSLAAVCLFLLVFNLRKRLSMLPLFRASMWKNAHVFGGILALALFWLHIDGLWPNGVYDQILGGFFYGAAISGVLGFCYQQVFPRRITQTGIEVIWERIPDEIIHLREQAEAVVLDCIREEASDTLARFYVETFQWFFRKPRFILSHLWGGQRAAFWVAQQLGTARRYLGGQELAYLDRLSDLAHAKVRLDLHYSVQGLLKLWLFFHVPFSVGLLVLALWHAVLVNVYAL